MLFYSAFGQANMRMLFCAWHLCTYITAYVLQVEVMWATDPLAQWRHGVGLGANNDSGSSSSKLLRPELPLSRHGRGNKLASTIVNPRSSNDGSSSVSEVPFRGREIIGYDDIL